MSKRGLDNNESSSPPTKKHIQMENYAPALITLENMLSSSFESLLFKLSQGVLLPIDIEKAKDASLYALESVKVASKSILVTDAKHQLALAINQLKEVQPKSYASVTSSSRHSPAPTPSHPAVPVTTNSSISLPPLTHHVVIKNNCANKPISGKDLLTTIKKSFSHVDLNIKFKGVNSSHNDKVVIHLDSKKDQDSLEKALKDATATNEDVSIYARKEIKPRCIVIGVDNDISPETVIENISTTLCLPNSEKITLVRRTKGNGSTSSIILETSNSAFTKVISMGRICIGWNAHKIEKANMIKQCYKCASLGHPSTSCRNAPKCSFCAGDHPFVECPSKKSPPKCINCLNAKLPATNHQANSTLCPILKGQSEKYYKALNL